ncbi:uncharacterized protein LOC129572412 [Sitodiplosis mosellana]|uniref:uncharacterized protein LOC129572412 n=1 Tax=Sitodiplosis mosellana TaxID=263140 RepID=UPI002443EE86|nr:uncharacterized protein LOC129572412 [Sitodiplosis mosellana]
MAKAKIAKRSKLILKSDKTSKLKSFSIILERLDPAKIKQYVRGNDDITHNLDIHIHRNEMRIHNVRSTAIDNSFNVHLKLSSEGLVVVQDISINDIEDRNPLEDKPTRNLRPKSNKANIIDDNSISKKKTCSKLVRSQSKTIYKMTEDAWRLCKNNHKRNGSKICVNDIVMAKLKGYPAWPAVVIELMNSRVKVEFFGAEPHEKVGFVSLNEITRFSESEEVIRLLLGRESRDTPKFRKSVEEAELVCGMPRFLSIVS